MFSRRLLSAAAALVTLHASAQVASAQTSCQFTAPTLTCSLPVFNLSATVVKIGKLDLSSSGPLAIGGSLADFEATETGNQADLTAFGGMTLTSKSNATFTVAISHPATFTDGVNPIIKPVSDVLIQFIPSGACPATGYVAMAGTSTAIHTAIPRQIISRNVCFKVRWLWAQDPAGTYVLPLTFNITAL